AWLRGSQLLTEDGKGIFQFDQMPFDVIILGDVTAQQLRDADKDAFAKIYDRVLTKRTGLLMMGGPYAFSKKQCGGTYIEKPLPIRLVEDPQQVEDVELKPTAEGLRYVLRLADQEEESKDRWRILNSQAKLGVTSLGEPLGRDKIFAETLAGRPLMVAHDFGSGRVMAFGADTTYRWVRPISAEMKKFDGAEVHSRFWRQVVLWLARQEDTDDNLRIRLDTRRLRTGDKLGFSVELRGKQGETLKDVRYQVKIIDPKGGETAVEVTPGGRGYSENELRGKFT